MSTRASAWAWDLEIEGMTSTLKIVLLRLADHADEDGFSFPRQSTIATKSYLSRQTVNKSLRQLEDMGLIKMDQRKHPTGAFRSSLYELIMPPRVKQSDTANSSGKDRVNYGDTAPPVSSRETRRHVNEGDRGCQAERQGLSNTPTEVVADDDTFNLHLEPSLQPPHEPAKGKQRKAAPWPKDAWIQFWALYPNKDAKGASLKSFQRIDEAGEVEFADIMEGLRHYVNKDDFREWAMPTTWLNQDRWEARPKQKVRGAPSGRFKRVVAI